MRKYIEESFHNISLFFLSKKMTIIPQHDCNNVVFEFVTSYNVKPAGTTSRYTIYEHAQRVKDLRALIHDHRKRFFFSLCVVDIKNTKK